MRIRVALVVGGAERGFSRTAGCEAKPGYGTPFPCERKPAHIADTNKPGPVFLTLDARI